MAPPADSKRAAVLGFPVSHSLSPRLHNYWLKHYGIAGSYEAIEVKPVELAGVLRALPKQGFTGVNLTIPHKEEALFIVNSADETAKRIGAVNTIIVRNGKLHGTNTDAYGFMENLKSQAGDVQPSDALVLGAGGAARAVCAGLADSGWKLTLAGRTRSKAESLAQSIGEKSVHVIDWEHIGKALPDTRLLVNTTPLGMKSQSPLELSLEKLAHDALVSDIVYSPLMTELLVNAKARGNKVITGLGMLLYQAQPAFEAWFGVKPVVNGELIQHMMNAL